MFVVAVAAMVLMDCKCYGARKDDITTAIFLYASDTINGLYLYTIWHLSNILIIIIYKHTAMFLV